MKLLIMQIFPSSSYILRLTSKDSLYPPITKYLKIHYLRINSEIEKTKRLIHENWRRNRIFLFRRSGLSSCTDTLV
jgi:hypothetical protein